MQCTALIFTPLLPLYSTPVQRTAVQCTTLQYSALHCRVQCSAPPHLQVTVVQHWVGRLQCHLGRVRNMRIYSLLYCGLDTLQHPTLHCNLLYCTVTSYITLHCAALIYIAFHSRPKVWAPDCSGLMQKKKLLFFYVILAQKGDTQEHTHKKDGNIQQNSTKVSVRKHVCLKGTLVYSANFFLQIITWMMKELNQNQ